LLHSHGTVEEEKTRKKWQYTGVWTADSRDLLGHSPMAN